jgi:hypothetical protein
MVQNTHRFRDQQKEVRFNRYCNATIRYPPLRRPVNVVAKWAWAVGKTGGGAVVDKKNSPFVSRFN